MTCALHVIKVSIRIHMHAAHGFVEVRRIHRVHVERLIAIGLSVAVEIDQSCQLITTDDENLEIPSGRGIMLMKAYMTHVEIKSPGNRIEMIFTRD